MLKDQKSNSDRLLERMSRYPSESRLTLVRNLSYGASAACLVLLAEILEVGLKSEALEIALVGSVVGIPLWIAVGGLYEMFLNLGKQSYPYLRTKAYQNTAGLLMLTAGFALVTAVGAAIWHLSFLAFVGFCCASVLAIVSQFVFAHLFANWWYSSKGPGAGSADESNQSLKG